MNKAYTNEQLAQDYFSVAAVYSGSKQAIDNHRYISKAIAAAEINIPIFYRKEKSLEKLQIKRIGPKIKGMLELILNRGVDEARKIVAAQKSEEIAPQWAGIAYKPPKIQDEYPPSWENAVNAYEEK